MNKRIAITGFGVKVPNGENNNDLLEHLISGEYDFTARNDITPNQEPLWVGEVLGDLGTLEDKQYRVLPRISKLAISTSAEALVMAGLDLTDPIIRRGVLWDHHGRYNSAGGYGPLRICRQVQRNACLLLRVGALSQSGFLHLQLFSSDRNLEDGNDRLHCRT